jgi:ribosomal protein RSM22 (predicted rRNA methylase)
MHHALQIIIDAELAGIPAAELARAARDVTSAYRGERSANARFLHSAAHRAAYLATRMPATYAAIQSTLRRLLEAVPTFTPESMLDLGAGPGTATLAAQDTFNTLKQFTLIERDPAMLDFARKLLANKAISGTQPLILNDDLSRASFPNADLVLCAYALNELSEPFRNALVQRAWAATKQALVLIEPGSRAGFSNILAARQYFIETGDATIAAPCPGHMPCSLAEVGDWCHFAARVQRTVLHRRLKDASLSYEDEKFSYVIAVKPSLAAQPANTRIVRRPEKLKGHVKLQLCTIDGLKSTTVTKKNGADYKRARDAEWGDAF